MTQLPRRAENRYRALLRRYLEQPEKTSKEAGASDALKAAASEIRLSEVAKIHRETLRDLANDPGASPAETEGKSSLSWKLFTLVMEHLETRDRAREKDYRQLARRHEALSRRYARLDARSQELSRAVEDRTQAEQAVRESAAHYLTLFAEASQIHEELRRVSREMIHVQEEERKRISRELHDELGQALTAVNVHLAMLRRLAGNAGPELLQRLDSASQILEHAMRAAHTFARDLRPAMLDDLGLAPALRSFARAFSERTRVPVSFRCHGEVERLEATAKTALYRVAQESLTNVAKHAHASRVVLSLRATGNRVRMRIRDNGRSFPAEEVLRAHSHSKGRLGLLGMRERILQVSGELRIESKPGFGTSVEASVPVSAIGGADGPAGLGDPNNNERPPQTAASHSRGKGE